MILTRHLYIHENVCHKNGIKTTSILYTESHKNFSILCGKFLKRILSNLYCIICNEINIRHSDIQKHLSHEKWLK